MCIPLFAFVARIGLCHDLCRRDFGSNLPFAFRDPLDTRKLELGLFSSSFVLTMRNHWKLKSLSNAARLAYKQIGCQNKKMQHRHAKTTGSRGEISRKWIQNTNRPTGNDIDQAPAVKLVSQVILQSFQFTAINVLFIVAMTIESATSGYLKDILDQRAPLSLAK